MPNLVAALKEEIRRLARKEIKSEIEATRRAGIQHRHDIAEMKRLLNLQARRIAALESGQRKAVGKDQKPEEDSGLPPGTRFSSRSVRAQRKKLRLSAEQYGKLLGVTGQTIYLWERGRTRPGKAQFVRLVGARNLGRREALRRLSGSKS